MESFSLKYKSGHSIKDRIHIGVVGSGDLEIIMEPVKDNEITFNVRTSSDGFQTIWNEVFERFVKEYNVGAHVIINDFGATPGVVRLRLAQAIEVLNVKK